eukprot:UN02730
MDLSALINVAPVVLNEKPAVKRSKSSCLPSSSSKKQCKKDIDKSNDFACTKHHASELQVCVNDDFENIEIKTKYDTYSEEMVKKFHEKTLHRIKAERRKSLESKCNILRQIKGTKNKINEGVKYVQLSVEKAQKRLSERKTKTDEAKDKLQDLSNVERGNYVQKKKERERIQFEEQQKRGRIYLLNFLYKRKYELLCDQKESSQIQNN